MTSLVREIRRRRVFRVAGAYVLVAWILMQAGEIVFPAFEIPNNALRLLILCLLGGFPCVVILAWILDISPTGIRLTRSFEATPDAAESEDGGANNSTNRLGRSFEMVLLGICIPIFAFAAVLVFLTQQDGDSSSLEPASLPSDGIPALAVLPFEDLSTIEGDNGFFARGVHEDILTHLSRVHPLKLISRTSVMTYSDTQKNVREIGKELGVDHILEGTVRRTATHVRVSAQLIRVRTDEHLWAENFDAELSDIFTVQTRIANSIANALEAELVSRPTTAPPPSSVVPAAYDAYLKARDIHRNLDAEDRAALARARQFYEVALRTDSTLAIAWTQLSVLHAQAHWFGFDPTDERAKKARQGLARAEELGVDPDQLALTEGILAYYLDGDFGKALLHFELAAELAPGNADAHFYQAMILRRSGELDRALAAQSVALDLDPLNLGYRDEYALTLALAGRLAESRAELEDILRIDPKRLRARFQKWQLDLELDGRPQALLNEIIASPRDRWADQHYSMLEVVAVLAGRPKIALEIMSKRPRPNPDSGHRDYQRAVLEGFAGNEEAKQGWLERSEMQFAALLNQSPDVMSEVDKRRVGALFAMQSRDFDRASSLQAENVEELPIEKDLIVGSAPLWLLLHIQLVAGQIDDAIETIDRLRSRVDVGGVLYGGYYVLENWPDFESARRDPRWSSLLDRVRPAYAKNWPTTDESARAAAE
jgi:TolB-like protein